MISEDDALVYLLHDQAYFDVCIHHFTPDYFTDEHKIIFQTISEFHQKYHKRIGISELKNEVEAKPLNQLLLDKTLDAVSRFSEPKPYESFQWCIDKAEEFCRDKAMYNAILECIGIIDKKSKKSPDAIPDILSQALAVSFEVNLGHDFIGSSLERFKYYHNPESRIPFHIPILNMITKNGVPRKTLNGIVAATGVGKTLALCDFAANYFLSGYNVLYVTLEMAQELIGFRMDCNLLDRTEEELLSLSEREYTTELNQISKSTKGRLIIREYPMLGANVETLRSLIRELRTKENFHPDILIVDYLTICSSARVKGNAEADSYFRGKAIAEELRGLLSSENLVGWTALQFNRGGYKNSDSDLTHIAESAGIAMTMDLLWAFLALDEYLARNQILGKQLKNRYNSIIQNNKFTLGIDYPKFRLYDCSEAADNYQIETREMLNTLGNESPNALIFRNKERNKFADFDIDS